MLTGVNFGFDDDEVLAHGPAAIAAGADGISPHAQISAALSWPSPLPGKATLATRRAC